MVIYSTCIFSILYMDVAVTNCLAVKYHFVNKGPIYFFFYSFCTEVQGDIRTGP